MTSAKDEVARRPRARHDPRAEPDSVPAMPAVQGKVAVVEEVVHGARQDPRADPDPTPPAPPAADHDDAKPETTAVSRASAPADPPRIPADPRFADLEPLFARNAWKEIVERLGPADKAAELPPALGLVFALAQREAAGEGSAAGATELAIKSMAALVGVPPASDTALVLAKRLLRQNPAGWRSKPAPAARFTVAIIVAGLAVGAGVGWFASLGSFHFF